MSEASHKRDHGHGTFGSFATRHATRTSKRDCGRCLRPRTISPTRLKPDPQPEGSARCWVMDQIRAQDHRGRTGASKARVLCGGTLQTRSPEVAADTEGCTSAGDAGSTTCKEYRTADSDAHESRGHAGASKAREFTRRAGRSSASEDADESGRVHYGRSLRVGRAAGHPDSYHLRLRPLRRRFAWRLGVLSPPIPLYRPTRLPTRPLGPARTKPSGWGRGGILREAWARSCCLCSGFCELCHRVTRDTLPLSQSAPPVCH